MSTTPSPMIQMYAPDGTFGEVPYEHMHEALQAGGKMAVHMKAPDGTDGYVPADRVQDAQKAGGAIVPFEQPAPAQQPGFMASVGNTLKSMIPTNVDPKQLAIGAAENMALPGLPSTLGAIKEGIAAHERGHGVPYSTLAATASGVGVNPERMEAAANQGNTSGVLSEAAVPATIAALGGGAKAIGDALPSAAEAGKAFQEVKGAAGNVPIDMTGPGKSALELFTQSQRGATLPKAVRQFVMRATDPNGAPITYSEAKDFQSNISRLSANERMNMNPNTVRLLGQLNQDLKGSLADAADVAGKGQQFKDAMKEYHQAMTLNDWTESAKANAVKLAIGSVVSALGIAGARKVWDALAP